MMMISGNLKSFNADSEMKNTNVMEESRFEYLLLLLLYCFVPHCASTNLSEKEYSYQKWEKIKPARRQKVLLELF
jgi:hypothetical protein